jgi:hypothetical protein
VDLAWRLGIVALLVATVIVLGGVRALRPRYRPRLGRLPPDAFPPGERAPLTAFYFTSRLCAECRDTPGIVHDAAPHVPAVPLKVHERPDLARALGVRETPTLLLVDREGRIRYARAGNPTADELRRAVAG